MNEILERVYFQNSVLDYLIAFGVIILGILLIKAFKKIILSRVRGWTENTKTHVDSFVVEHIDRFGIPALYFAVIYAGLNYLIFTERGDRILSIAVGFVITFLLIRFLSATVRVLLRSYFKRRTGGEERIKQLGGIMLIINMIIWAVGLLFLFSNMGYDVTAIVAGLGIGGIAVALAAQNILGDLFNYFVIFLDRPFEIGDFIIIDNKMGVVEHIGVKTTRIKSLSGEQLVFSNSDLTNSRIHNYKRMERRRVLFRFGVIYQTSYEHVRQIPELVKSFVLEQEGVEFDRAHFASYGESSLDFEVVYYVLNSDYGVYMNTQQAVNLRMFEEFQKMGIDFAYPTRTLYVNNK